MRRLIPLLFGLWVLALPAGAQAFVPSDPLAQRQWYLTQIHAFDAWPALPTNLSPVRVAVVDSGIDDGHPEFAGKIVAAKSFVGGSPLSDEQGHGTFVAGEIAAGTDNRIGIAGIAPAAQLVIAKIVRRDGSISLEAEAEAIHWAVDQRARVISLSFGGLRDPKSTSRDSYSPVEAAAVRYAVAHGVLVVAAVGNGDQAPSQPWAYASYPAALPHVVGVSASSEAGSVPDFSNRDLVLNDVAAPGVDMLSTFPRALTALRPTCPDQGYSDCASDEYANAEGTSFAAPQVAAAAADLLGIDPGLQPDQVSWLLERSADDADPSSGCAACAVGRDPLTGWGRLDIAKAIAALVAGQIPPPDHFEPNNEAGEQAHMLSGARRRVRATIDFWDNPIDVYRVYLRKAQTIHATLKGTPATALLLWKPGTTTVTGASSRLRNLTLRARGTGSLKQMTYKARRPGWHYLEINATAPGFTTYILTVRKRAPTR